MILKRRAPGFELLVYYLRRFGKLAVILVLAVWLGAWFVLAGGPEKMRVWSTQNTLRLTADMGFEVRNVMVVGRRNTSPELLKSTINVEKGDPIFAFNPEKTRRNIERISWVKAARVERRLPDTIYIGIDERIPLALWKDGQRLALVDGEGVVLAEKDLEAYRDLIIITGDGAPERASELFSQLDAEPELKERMEYARWVSVRRWDLFLKNGIEVLLPEQDTGLALRRLMAAHEEGSLLDKDIVNIDLRKTDRLIVKPRRGEALNWQAGTNEDLFRPNR